jgi:hypothetical protein
LFLAAHKQEEGFCPKELERKKFTKENFRKELFLPNRKPSSAALVVEAAQKVNSLTIKNLVFAG